MPNLLDESKTSLKDFENRRRTRFKLAVFTVLAVLAAVLLAVLLSKLRTTSGGAPEDANRALTNASSVANDP